MRKLFWTFAGRMALSIVTSIAGALVVTQLGLLEPKSPQKLERIVFDSDLTRAEESAARVEAAHIALRDQLAALRAEAERRAAPPAEQPGASEASTQAHRPSPAQERRKATAQRRDLAAPPPLAAPSTPLVITPATAQQTPVTPARTPLEGVFDKLASGVGRIRDAIIDAVKIEKPSTQPFGAASASNATLPAIGDLRERIRLPLVDM